MSIANEMAHSSEKIQHVLKVGKINLGGSDMYLGTWAYTSCRLANILWPVKLCSIPKDVYSNIYMYCILQPNR